MNDAKEKTVLATSVGADERQPFQTNIENIIPTSTEEINDFDVNSSENYEEMLRQMQRMTSPYYLHTVSMTELIRPPTRADRRLSAACSTVERISLQEPQKAASPFWWLR